MKTRSLLAIALCSGFALTTIATGIARADVIKDNGAKVQVEIPNGWKQAKGGGGVQATDPQNQVLLFFQTVPAKDLQKALTASAKMAKKIATKISMEAPEPVEINGLKGQESKGKALIKGKAVKLLTLVLMLPSGKAAMVFGVADDATFAAHVGELKGIVGSIKATN